MKSTPYKPSILCFLFNNRKVGENSFSFFLVLTILCFGFVTTAKASTITNAVFDSSALSTLEESIVPPPAPTGLAIQIYTGDDKTLANLTVIGTTIKWYDARINGNLLASTTSLVDNTIYYASDTNALGESTSRLSVTVRRISDNFQTFASCATTPTVADLVATPSIGTTAQWFAVSSNGTALLPTDVLTNGTYYVEQPTPEIIETLEFGGGYDVYFGIAAQSDGKIIIVDTSNNVIRRMDADGSNIEILGSGFNNPNGLTLQSDGKILIADTDNDVVKRMDADGTNIEILGSGFSTPSGVAVQSDGKILIADSGNNVIKRMDADGSNIVTLVSGLNFPDDVVVQSDGKIVFSNSGNTIKRMDADGNNIVTLGSGFSQIYGVAIQPDGKILIADLNYQVIKRMDADGTNIETLLSEVYPLSIGLQSDGKILFTANTINGIKRFAEAGASVSNRVAVTIASLAPTGLTTQIYTGDDKTLANLSVTGTTIKWYDAATNGSLLPNTTALVDNTIYYASNTTACDESILRLAVTVKRISDNIQTITSCAVSTTVADLVATPSIGVTAQWFTASSGGTAMLPTDVLTAGTYYVEQPSVESIETLGTGFNTPYGVALQSDGKILIADNDNSLIKRMNADGTNIEILGSGFSAPSGVAVQTDGKILIADWGNDLIYRMDADGTNIETLGSGFSPFGVAVQTDGKIIIADAGNNAIKRMDADGTNIVSLGSGFRFPSKVTVQSDGKILIADAGNYAIKRMDADGTNIETLGSGVTPYGVVVQSDGKILIADRGNDLIYRMDADGANIEILGSGFVDPAQVLIQPDGKIIIADSGNNTIKRLTEASVSNRVAVIISSPVPTGLATQVYTGDDKTLADLNITGTTIKWYDAAIDGSLLPNTTTLVNTTVYYASNTTACGESTLRLAVTVKRISDNTQIIASCPATVADLAATPSIGASIQWFTASSGGTAKLGADDLTSGTYYVQQQTPESIETLGSGFNAPIGVAVQSDGKIIIADANNNGIKRMDIDGANIETLGSGFSTPIDVAVQSDGKIIILEYYNNAVKRMDADGTNIVALGSGFLNPYGVAVQSDGKIIIADSGNNAIKRMDADGTNIVTLGTGFLNPVGVSVQPDGKIIIADNGNDAVKRMDADGSNIVTLGTGFLNPIGVSVQPDGKIIIADNGNDAVKRMDADGSNIEILGSGFSSPYKVAIQSDGDILISDLGNNAIKRYTNTIVSNRVVVPVLVTNLAPTGLTTQVYTGDDKTIASLTVTGTTIKWYDAATDGTLLANTTTLVDNTIYYASNTAACGESITRLAVTVKRVSDNIQAIASCAATVNDLVAIPSSGSIVQWFTANSGGIAMLSSDVLTSGTYYVEQQTPDSIETFGSGFNAPTGIAIQSDGKILIADSGNNVIKRTNADGTNIEILGSGFSSPYGVAVQSDGKILIADVGNHTIKRMNSDGTSIETLGSGFSSPYKVVVQPDGKILIADSGNSAIKRMDADGTNIEILGSGFSTPYGVAVQSDGKILIADSGNSAIKRMNADGTNIEILGSGFNSPLAVYQQVGGKILIADSSNSAIKRMDADGTNIQTLVSNISSLSLSVQSNGKILIAEPAGNSVKLFTEAGVSNRVAVTASITSIAPTGLATQIYTGDDKTLASLTVIGSTIKWYNAATDGTLLANTTTLVDNTIYYASNTAACSESITRLAVTVNRISDNLQTIVSCPTTVANLLATPSTGATAQWFAASSGGIAMSNTDVLTSGTFYVEQQTPESIKTLGSGFHLPNSVAIQSDGKILIADGGNSAIKLMDADGTNVVTLVSGVTPFEIVIQSDGKILIAEPGQDAIKRMDTDGTNIETLGSGFSNVNGIALQSDGKILIADTFNSAIKRMDADGTNIVTLGSGFSYPFGVAVQSDGKILIADTFNSAIKRMDADGTNIEILGSGFSPHGVSVQPDGKILIADSGNNAIKRMDTDGTNIETLVSGLKSPYGVAVKPDGEIIIVDRQNNAIKSYTDAIVSNRVAVINSSLAPTGLTVQVYTGDDKTIANLTVTGTTIKWYDAATDGNLLPNTTTLVDNTIYYASNTTACGESTSRLAVTVNRISENTQTIASCVATVADLVATPSIGVTAEWFTNNSGGLALLNTDVLTNGSYFLEEPITTEVFETLLSGLNNPYGVAVQSDDKILIVDTNNNVIKRMDADGTNIETLGPVFNQPRGVAVQSDGKILIADYSNNAIKRMDADGTNIETLNSSFFGPTGVAVQSNGKIIIADSFNNAIKCMDADGGNIKTLGSGFANPYGVAVQPDGKILISDTFNGAIKRMNSDGTNIEILGSGFSFPSGVAVQSDGKILIADTGNNAIKRMDADGTNVETLRSGGSDLRGVSIQSDGKIIIADVGNDEINRFTEAISSNRVEVAVFLGSEINLEGNATSIVSGDATPSILDATDFGDSASNVSIVKTYTIQNTSATLLTINSIVSSGTDAADFVVGGVTLPATIATGASSTFTVTFNSVSSGEKTATITIDNDDCDEGVYTFAVKSRIVPSWTGAVSSDWNIAGNWNNNVVPLASVNVTITDMATTPDITSSIEINDLTIQASSAFNISGSGSVKVEGNLNTAETITMKSDVTNSSVLFVQGTSNGQVSYQRAGLLANKWSLVTAPVTGQSVKDFVEDAANEIRVNTTVTPNRYAVGYYDDAQVSGSKWVYYTVTDLASNTISFEEGKSYIISRKTDGVVTFTGTLTTNDVDKTVVASQWTAVGNPYTTFFPVNKNSDNNFINDNLNNFDPLNTAIYSWDNTQNKYVAVSLLNTAKSLPPGQGFFVKTDSGITSIVFNQDKRQIQPVTGTNTFGRDSETIINLKLKAARNNVSVTTDLNYFSAATKGLDPGYDVGNYGATSFDLYTKLLEGYENENFTIQSLPNSNYDQMIVSVGLKASAGSVVAFSMEALNLPADIEVFLEDKQTNELVRLDLANTEHSIYVTEEINGIGRFYLHTQSKSLNIEGTDLGNNIRIYTSKKDNLRIEGLTVAPGNTSIKMYTLLGKEVLKTVFETKVINDVDIPVLSAGVYLVQLTNSNGKVRKKIVLN